MKKVILTVATIASAFVSSASILYWQVNETDVSDFSGQYDTLRIVGTNDGLATTTIQDAYYVTQSGLTSTKTASTETEYYTNLTEGFTYYIELMNSSAVVARSAGLAYNDSGTYIQTGTITSDLSSIPTVSTVSFWHGSPYTAVPEPTSAMLMLCGAAFLGLKRKNRRIA